MGYKRSKIAIINSNSEVLLDEEGYKGSGNAQQYDDLTFNLFGKRLYSTAGKVDFDWDRITAKFQAGGNITNKSDCAFGNEPYGHKWKQSTSPTDLIRIYPHFHWMQWNDTDQYTLTVQYRVLNNGVAYADDSTSWTTITATTCDGNDVFPFDLNGKDFMHQITEFEHIDLYLDISAEF